tara:strand:- start:209 stop:508 length:300 start_codon:yes stop_codon:yes gene_type:complete
MTFKFDSLVNTTFGSLISEAEEASPDTVMKTIKPFAKRWDRMGMKDKAVAVATGGKAMRKASKINKKFDKYMKGPHLKKANNDAEKIVDDMMSGVQDMK